jgi:hypothetical protein
MTDTEKSQIKEILWNWARKHPTPKATSLILPSGSFSPIHLAREVEKETPVGISS